MAGYNSGRKAPNVSQYLANLNAMPSPHDVATQQEENFGLDDDLAQFTNAEFLDFDTRADFLDQGMPEFGPNQGEHARRQSAGNIDAKGMDFGTSLDGVPIQIDCFTRRPCLGLYIVTRRRRAIIEDS